MPGRASSRCASLGRAEGVSGEPWRPPRSLRDRRCGERPPSPRHPAGRHGTPARHHAACPGAEGRVRPALAGGTEPLSQSAARARWAWPRSPRANGGTPVSGP